MSKCLYPFDDDGTVIAAVSSSTFSSVDLINSNYSKRPLRQGEGKAKATQVVQNLPIITPMELFQQLPTQFPGKHTRSAATDATSLGIQHSLAVHVPGIHFKYSWVDRRNRSKTLF